MMKELLEIILRRGGESVLLNQLFFISQSDLYTLLQLWETAYIRYYV